jgi:hypothetical protein
MATGISTLRPPPTEILLQRAAMLQSVSVPRSQFGRAILEQGQAVSSGSHRAMTSLRPTISPSSSLLRSGHGCASMSPRPGHRGRFFGFRVRQVRVIAAGNNGSWIAARRDEFGSLQSITSSASNWMALGTSMPSALAVCRGRYFRSHRLHPSRVARMALTRPAAAAAAACPGSGRKPSPQSSARRH